MIKAGGVIYNQGTGEVALVRMLDGQVCFVSAKMDECEIVAYTRALPEVVFHSGETENNTAVTAVIHNVGTDCSVGEGSVGAHVNVHCVCCRSSKCAVT